MYRVELTLWGKDIVSSNEPVHPWHTVLFTGTKEECEYFIKPPKK